MLDFLRDDPSSHQSPATSLDQHQQELEGPGGCEAYGISSIGPTATAASDPGVPAISTNKDILHTEEMPVVHKYTPAAAQYNNWQHQPQLAAAASPPGSGSYNDAAATAAAAAPMSVPSSFEAAAADAAATVMPAAAGVSKDTTTAAPAAAEDACPAPAAAAVAAAAGGAPKGLGLPRLEVATSEAAADPAMQSPQGLGPLLSLQVQCYNMSQLVSFSF